MRNLIFSLSSISLEWKTATFFFSTILVLSISSCVSKNESEQANKSDSAICCQPASRFANAATGKADSLEKKNVTVSRQGMVWIEGGEFEMGCSDAEGRDRKSVV